MFLALLRVYNPLKSGGNFYKKLISFDPVVPLLGLYPKKKLNNNSNKIIKQKCIVVYSA